MKNALLNKDKMIKSESNQLKIFNSLVKRVFSYGLYLDDGYIIIPYLNSILYYNPNTKDYKFLSRVHIKSELKPINYNEYINLIKDLPLLDPRFYKYLLDNKFSLTKATYSDINLVKNNPILNTFRISEIEKMWFELNPEIKKYKNYSSKEILYL